MAEKRKKIVLVTPRGVAKFIWVNKPSVKFDADGTFSVDLVLSESDSQGLRNQLTQMTEQYRSEAVKEEPKTKGYGTHLPFSEELDAEGNPTGNFVFKFKQKARIKRKNPKPGEEPYFNKTIGIFDAAKKPITENVGRGSEIKVAFEPAPFTAASLKKHGLSLRLEAVQVLNLKTWTGGTADDFGFGEEEGYHGEEEAVMPEGSPSTAEKGSDF